MDEGTTEKPSCLSSNSQSALLKGKGRWDSRMGRSFGQVQHAQKYSSASGRLAQVARRDRVLLPGKSGGQAFDYDV
jgi:hypothetical protein